MLVDGVDVRDYPLEELRGKVGVVPQKAVLFKGTIRENLKWGKADATEEAAKAEPAGKPEKSVKKTARTDKKPTTKKTAAKKTVKKAVKATEAESTATDEPKKPVRRRTKKTTDVTDESKAE